MLAVVLYTRLVAMSQGYTETPYGECYDRRGCSTYVYGGPWLIGDQRDT